MTPDMGLRYAILAPAVLLLNPAAALAKMRGR
jgi:hypothetical protein